jgi:tripartite-type tricarboxylate transporter receptor subunit TctC
MNVLKAVLLAAALVSPLSGYAQSYPAKPVRVVCPYPPGSSADIIGRIYSPKLAEALGRPFVVDNRVGASGNIAGELVARAAPDGYTLLLLNTPIATSPLIIKGVPFDALRDFQPIGMLGLAPHLLVVNNAMPVKNVKELVAYAKANPGKIRFGSSEPSSRLAGELFKQVAGVDMVHVPYKGGSQIMTDLLGGHIEAGFTSTFTVTPHHRSGKLRVLAVAGAKRDPAMPDVPTAIEAGLPNYETYVWYAMYAPKGTPPAIVSKIQQDIAKIVAIPEVREKFISLGAEPIASTPEQFAAFTRSEYDRYAKVIRDGNIKAE